MIEKNKTKKCTFFNNDGKLIKIKINNSELIIKRLEQTEKYRKLEQKYKAEKNYLLMKIREEQDKIAKLKYANNKEDFLKNN